MGRQLTTARAGIAAGMVWLSFLIGATPAFSATASFVGNLTTIIENSGTGTYASAALGSTFSGSVVYGNSASDAWFTEIDGVTGDTAYWLFAGSSYGGVLTNGVSSTIGVESEVEVINDWVLDADDASVFEFLTGIPVVAGTVVDGWAASALTSGAYYDYDQENEVDTLFGGTAFGIALFSFNSSLYSGLDYHNSPPELASVDAGLFFIEQGDALGNLQYLAYGNLTAVTDVPVPASVWLFGSSLLTLAGMARRRSANRIDQAR